MIEGRKILIQDEFILRDTCEASWGITTDAIIKIKDKGKAVLKLNGKLMFAKIISPEGAQFSIEQAEQAEPQKINLGVSRLMVHIPAAMGKLTIAVLLTPYEKESMGVVEMKCLGEW
jgi:hypothetical protein